MIADGAKIYAYPYEGYWVDVGTLDAFWQSHMDLLSDPPPFKIYDPDWIIHTRTEERPPAIIKKERPWKIV